MKKCLICGEMTAGSIGAAGIRWPVICQPCKDREDGALAERVVAQQEAVNNILFALGETAHRDDEEKAA